MLKEEARLSHVSRATRCLDTTYPARDPRDRRENGGAR